MQVELASGVDRDLQALQLRQGIGASLGLDLAVDPDCDGG
jgi:hypothetical protein